MLPDSLLQQLISENELLQIQLQDVNEMIQVREEELEILRNTAAHAIQLQSRLDMNLDEFYSLQDIIGNQQQDAEGSAKREASLEEELMHSINMETEFYNIKDQFESTKAALMDVQSEMDTVASLYKQIAELSTRVAELESSHEIASMENGFLKEELEELRKLAKKENKESDG